METKLLNECKEMLSRKPDANINTIAQILASKYKTKLARGNYEKSLQVVLNLFFDNMNFLTGGIS